MLHWFAATLRSYPEIALFLSLAVGYYVGGFSYRGFSLGAVTATLIAAVVIGQLGITISPNVKSVFFLIFLFAVGYGVGPQFVRGIASDGLPQALFAAVVCLFCLAAPVIVAKLAGYDLGYAAGLYAGSQTISASMGLATDAINRLGVPPDQTKDLLNAMPIAYAVTYIFGTVGSAILLAQVGPKLLGIDLVAACKAYEARQGGTAETGGAGSAWHRWELRAFRVASGGRAERMTAAEVEALVSGARVFIQRIRRDGRIEDATADTVLQAGDIVAVAGPRQVLVDVLGQAAEEVDDPELLNVPIEGVDVYVTNKAVDGKTLAELASLPAARGVFLRRIVRGATATVIPILPNTKIQRGDILTIVGRTQDTNAAAKMLGVADRPSDVADVAFIGWRHHVGGAGRRRGAPRRWRAADAFDRRRCADCRYRVWLAALRSAHLRTDSVLDRVVHELGRAERLYRGGRHLRRARFRRRTAEAGHQPVPVGRCFHLGAADPGDVCRQIRVPLRPGDTAWAVAPERAPPPPLLA